jgi:hypothetical protein
LSNCSFAETVTNQIIPAASPAKQECHIESAKKWPATEALSQLHASKRGTIIQRIVALDVLRKKLSAKYTIPTRYAGRKENGM